MKLSYYIFLFLFILAACYEKSSDRITIPEGPPSLSAEKMSAILTDMHLAQAALKTEQELNVYHYSHNKEFHLKVFKKHDITQAEFEESLEYYKYHPEELDRIYENILRDLSVMESQAEQEVQRQKDSIQQVISDSIAIMKDTASKTEVLGEERAWWGF